MMTLYRSPAIRQYAKHLPCQYCFANDRTIVMAHSNQLAHGKGGQIKSHDCFVAALCKHCHDIVDGRALPNLPQQLREELWTIAFKRTLPLLMDAGLINERATELLEQSALL